MKMSQVLILSQALNAIKSDRLSGKPMYAVARNIRFLENDILTYNKKRDSLIKEISGGKNTIKQDDTEAIQKFQEAQEAELGADIEVKLHKFTLTEKQLEGAFDARILAVLLEHDLVTVVDSTPAPAEEPKLEVVEA